MVKPFFKHRTSDFRGKSSMAEDRAAQKAASAQTVHLEQRA